MNKFEQIYNDKSKELRDLKYELESNQNKMEELKSMTSNLYRHIIESEKELEVAKQYNALYEAAKLMVNNPYSAAMHQDEVPASIESEHL